MPLERLYPASGDGAIAVDPSRNVAPYLDFLSQHDARLAAIFLTHRPASFASGWAELRRATGATLYAAAEFPFLEPGAGILAQNTTVVHFGEAGRISVTRTPGFSADSLCLRLLDGTGQVVGTFTGGAILNDGCGYPLPRPGDRNPLNGPRTYAREMYTTANEIIAGFPDRKPAYSGFGNDFHYARAEDHNHVRFSLAEEKKENPIFLEKTADAFADWLLEDMPPPPAYYAACLERNPKGYPDYTAALRPFLDFATAHRRGGPAAVNPAVPTGENTLLVDVRPAADFHATHAPRAVNIGLDGPFTLWLGSIVRPGEPVFFLLADPARAADVGDAVAKIGYDEQVAGLAQWTGGLNEVTDPPLDVPDLRDHHATKYTIVDVRPPHVARTDTRFNGALNFPLATLRHKWGGIPRDRPIVVHCGGGYHSAIGASLLRRELGGDVTVYDLGGAITDFKPA